MASVFMNPVSLEPTPPFAALIFDCDGTVANTLPIHYQAWSEAVRAFDIEITPEWYYSRAGISSSELIEMMKEAFRPDLDADQVKAEKQRVFHALVEQISVIQPVADIIRAYRGKVPLAIASGGSRVLVEATLTSTGLIDHFDCIVTIENVERGKPAPDIFLMSAQKLQVEPQDCIVYEDSDIGLEAAHRAGMRAIDVRLAQAHASVS